jgi:hypothetical protein
VTVEIDISDIPLETFYTDERCKRIERIIQSKEKFKDFRVKRLRREEDPSLDIYIMMDATENFWVWMNEWEVDALNDSEILSYITVTKETSQRTNPTESWSFILMCFSMSLFLVFPLIIVFVPEFPMYDFIFGIMVISLIASIVFGLNFKRKNDEYKQSEREFEMEIMEQHPLFVESLRKFATLQDITDSQREEYLERIQEIESKMADI